MRAGIHIAALLCALVAARADDDRAACKTPCTVEFSFKPGGAGASPRAAMC
ncbi:MAG TPA: hypothetical protein PK490_13085 [Prosthecobacter sp.]|nr:hypothetical protein [Prosthecobacter sp.]HRK15222.1 hypothetical protein [Prosthecobacter sp.]